MTLASSERMRVLAPLLLASAAGWLLLAAAALGLGPAMAAAGHGAHSEAYPLGILAWALMLPAMMLPLLGAPLLHLRARSFARRRARAGALFVSAYFLVWLAAGPLVIGFGSALRSFPAAFGAALAVATAMIWQCSPFKQDCLNRCHWQPELRAFGWSADRDAILYGLRHGGWCAASCVPPMLIPLVTPAHLGAMAAVAALMAAERLDGPAPPRWRLRWPAKAFRILVAASGTPRSFAWRYDAARYSGL